MRRCRRFGGLARGCLLAVVVATAAWGEPPADDAAAAPSDESSLIDLPSALRLAGGQNLDVKIAEQKLAEARASDKVALEKFFPTLSAGIVYRRHDDAIQNVQGDVIDTHKQSYAPGATLALQTDIGEAIFKSLEEHQRVKAAGHDVETQRQDAIVAAAGAYFDLVRAHAAIAAAEEASRISADYTRQVEAAVGIGLAFKGDALRAHGLEQDDKLAKRRAQEQRRVAAVQLATIVDLEPTLSLKPRDTMPVPLALLPAEQSTETLLEKALANRPEIKKRAAEVAAAQEAEKGAVYGPLVPSLGAQIFAGGVGGGQTGSPQRFGESADYLMGLNWRLGPGGLFDVGRIEASQARQRGAMLVEDKQRKQIAAEIRTDKEQVDSLGEQVGITQQALDDAREALRLRLQRQDFGVAAVLETIQAHRDWTRALNDYLVQVTEYNKVQYKLLRAAGMLGPNAQP